MPRQISVVARDANGYYNYYCRQCGRIHLQAEWPVLCKECGNIEVVEGWGVSGDAGVSNTTTTKFRRYNSYASVGTIDLPRG